MAACHTRSTVQFGAVGEGDKGGTGTADGIHNCGPGMDGRDQFYVWWILRVNLERWIDEDKDSPCDLRIPRGCLSLARHGHVGREIGRNFFLNKSISLLMHDAYDM